MSTLPPRDVPYETELLQREGSSELDCAAYLRAVRRWWRLVGAACLVAMTAGAIHYLVAPKAYKATAIIQIQRRPLAQSLDHQSPALEGYLDADYYATAYKLLDSRGLAERVVRSLDLQSNPAFHPRGPVHAQEKAARGAMRDDDLERLGSLADRLREGLSIEPVRNTQLVAISYRDRSPAFAARAANRFAEAFIDMGIEYRFTSTGKTSTFLDSQVETLKKVVADKEAKLLALSRRTNIVDLDPSANPSLQRLQALSATYVDTMNARLERAASYKALLTASPEATADAFQPGLVGPMRSEVRKLERDYEAQLKVYKPDWPSMVALKSEVDKGKQNLAAAVKQAVDAARQSAYAAYETALAQERQLTTEIEKVKSQIMDQSSLGAEFRTLSEEIKSRREVLDKLLRSQSETDVEARLEDTGDSNVHVVDRALLPRRPCYPSLQTDATFSLLSGLLLGIVAAILLELLDRTVKTPEEVEQRFGLPLLAVIQELDERAKASGPAAPYGRAQIELVPYEHPRSQIAEGYRSLRTALLLSSADKLEVVAVTSAAMDEGKTTTAANLAIVLAQLGRPVLIVDADLRKPCLHKVFKVANPLGLVNHLTATADGGEIIYPTTIPNLWITPAGPIAPTPSELLSSSRMYDWLRFVRGRFDFVVVDTPPMLAVTDAIIVGAIADGVVLALRSGKVTRDEARLCRDRLRQADVRILGAVLSRHRAEHSGIYDGYHSYETYVETCMAAERAATARTGSAA